MGPPEESMDAEDTAEFAHGRLEMLLHVCNLDGVMQ